MATVTDNNDGTLTITLTEVEQRYWKWAVKSKLEWFAQQITLNLEGQGRGEFDRRLSELTLARRGKLLSDMDAL